WDTVYAGITPQTVWIAIDTLPPEFIRQDNHVRMGVGLFISEVATDGDLNTKGREKFRRDTHDFLLLHGARITDGFGSLHIHGEALEGRDVAAPLVVIGYRRAIILDSGFWIGVEDRHQPIGLRKWKRTEQNRINYRENREVRAETDRDRGQRGHGEGRGLAQLPQSELRIVHVTRSVRRPSDRPPLPDGPGNTWRPTRRRPKRW